jgi:hypothetical protein
MSPELLTEDDALVAGTLIFDSLQNNRTGITNQIIVAFDRYTEIISEKWRFAFVTYLFSTFIYYSSSEEDLKAKLAAERILELSDSSRPDAEGSDEKKSLAKYIHDMVTNYLARTSSFNRHQRRAMAAKKKRR